MTSFKDRWFAEFERRVGDYEDTGMPVDRAHELAAEDAYDAVVDAGSDVDRFDNMSEEDIEALADEHEWRKGRE